jgi:arginyl-tRNA synthetase
MNIFSEFSERLLGHLQSAQAAGQIPSALDVSRITVEPPRDPSHGDLATNIAMVLAKPAAMSPRDTAHVIAERLAQDDDVENVEIAGPGFINIRLAIKVWHASIGHVLMAGVGYGRSTMGAGEKINLEYVSANPTGPMHVGHARGAVVGDALAGLLAAAGYQVTKEYYINDAGGQIEVLARSALLRMREAQGETIGEIPEGLYPGDYLIPVGEALATTHSSEMAEANEESQIDIAKGVTRSFSVRTVAAPKWRRRCGLGGA